jgi:PAS domain S-box-containing protein
MNAGVILEKFKRGCYIKRKRVEMELSASEKNYRSLVENANSIILRWKPDGEITFFNKFAQTFFGYSEEEILGKNIVILLPEKDSLGRDLSSLAKDIVEHPERYISTINENIRSSGERAWVNWTNRAIVDERGHVQEILAIGNDITTMKRMEEELKTSEERYRNLVEHSPYGIAVHSEGQFIFINPAGASILGAAAPEAVVGRSVLDIIHPESLDRIMVCIESTEHGMPTPLMAHTLVRFDGRTFYGEVIGIPFKFSGRKATQIIFRDITDRKRSEEQIEQLNRELKNKVQELETVFNTAPIGLAIAEDPQGLYIRGNPTNERMLGVPRDGELSKRAALDRFPATFRTLKDGREIPVDELPMQRAVRGETVKGQILDIIRNDGRTIKLFSNAEPLLDKQGRPRGAVGAFMDITELKQVEEELRKSNDRLEILAETASRLLVSGRPMMIINDLCRKIMAHLDCQVFFNYLVDEKQDRLRLNAWDGIPEETAHGIQWLDFGVAVCGCVAREGRRIVAEHIFDTQDPRTDLIRSFGVKAYACHPLISEGYVIGTLSFGTLTRPTFTEDELALMRVVADQVSIAMERMRHIEELRAARKDLQKSHDALEARVRERTEKLRQAVERLEAEAAERLRAEKALRESREKLYDTLESITDGFFTLDRSWRFTYLNREAEKIWKKKREELIEKTLWEVSPVSVGTVFEEQYRKAMIEKVPVSFVALSPLVGLWIEVRAYPTADGIAVYARDITKRKKTEEALQRMIDYNRKLIEAGLDPLVTIDQEGKISDVNAATENVTGYSREELIGTDFTDYFTEPDKAKAGYKLVFQEGSVRDYALGISHRDGRVTPVLYNATVFRNEAGEVIGVFAAARDITERLETEKKLRESNEQLRALTSELVMAEESARRRIAVDLHDHVSQSLAVAKLRLETLQQKATEYGLLNPVREVRELIDESIKQTRSLMAELSPSVLYELGLAPAMEWLTEQIKTKYGVTVQLRNDLTAKRFDQDIQVLLFQAVRELLLNIIKHAKSNHASVSLQEIGDHIRIRVRDDGVGFDKARLGNGMDLEGGFGLFSIRERLKHFGGSLEINTGPGKGTSVTIEAPHRKRKKTQRRVRHVH